MLRIRPELPDPIGFMDLALNSESESESRSESVEAYVPPEIEISKFMYVLLSPVLLLA
jgi:hypothetical protein